ncbi:MAG: PEP-CTERM sorting domain-containing protein [Candidatus Spyradosoma sp.]
MKNIIPITTLLVAGTAFANAALSSETSWENVPSSAVSGSNIATWTTSDSALIWNTAWSVALTVDKDALGTSNLTLLAMTPKCYQTTTSGTYSNQKNFDGFTGITYDYNSSGSTLSIEFFGTTGTASSAFSSLSATENLTFVLSKTAPTNNKSNLVLNVYGDENFDTALTTVTLSDIASNYTTYSGTLLEFGGLGGISTETQTNAGFYSNNAGAFTLKAASYWTGGNVDSTALSAYYAAIVPEPSAFGLLAGVGALALVAARRRRSKKA